MKKIICAFFFIFMASLLMPTTQAAAAGNYGNSRIVSVDEYGRPQILVDGETDPYLYTLCCWYGFTVEDCESINSHGYNHDMLYTLPITIEKYEIPLDMGVYGIAAIYNVTQESIQHLNALEDVTAIQAGDFLYIPRPLNVSVQVPETQNIAATVTTTTSTTTTVEITTTESITTTTVATTTATQATTTAETTKVTQVTTQATTVPENSYQIKSGDELDKLANKFGTTRAVLMQLNPWITDPNLIVVGKWLKLPTSNDSISVETEGNQVENVENSDGIHVVKADEYLSTIAAKYKTTVSNLLKLNPEITNPDLIQVGQKIKVPTGNNTTEVPSTPVENATLPEEMWIVLQDLKKKYPHMRIGVGLYTPNGSYTYNSSQRITGCCTIKASYALFVIKECVRNGIDIYNTRLTYQSWHYNAGSGVIKNSEYGTTYTIYELLYNLITVSDNTAYNILTSRFSLEDFYVYNRNIGGQNDGLQYGSASVEQRYAEWNQIIQYINSDAKYADELYYILDVAQYGYLEQGMPSYHNVLHKSGWSTGSYNGACDVAWIDGKYLLIVMTDDYTTNTAHTDAVRAIGRAFDAIY